MLMSNQPRHFETFASLIREGPSYLHAERYERGESPRGNLSWDLHEIITGYINKGEVSWEKALVMPKRIEYRRSEREVFEGKKGNLVWIIEPSLDGEHLIDLDNLKHLFYGYIENDYLHITRIISGGANLRQCLSKIRTRQTEGLVHFRLDLPSNLPVQSKVMIFSKLNDAEFLKAMNEF